MDSTNELQTLIRDHIYLGHSCVETFCNLCNKFGIKYDLETKQLNYIFDKIEKEPNTGLEEFSLCEKLSTDALNLLQKVQEDFRRFKFGIEERKCNGVNWVNKNLELINDHFELTQEIFCTFNFQTHSRLPVNAV